MTSTAPASPASPPEARAVHSSTRVARNCVTPNAALKQRLDQRITASGLSSYNSFGMIATEAAWRTGEAWLDALLL